MLKNNGKKFFLIATNDLERRKMLTVWINNRFTDAVIYTAVDYMECLVKIKNAPPNILVTDYVLEKARPGQIIDYLLLEPDTRIGMIALGAKAVVQNHLDAVTAGNINFIENLKEVEDFYAAINSVSRFAFDNESKDYHLRILKPGEILFKEGDISKNVFIVKKGELQAYHHIGSERVLLGNIQAGEFVGEMAYFNGEPRIATIEAVTDCELIEIPPRTFEKVIYQRPTWIKLLFSTLSKRLKKKNSNATDPLK